METPAEDLWKMYEKVNIPFGKSPCLMESPPWKHRKIHDFLVDKSAKNDGKPWSMLYPLVKREQKTMERSTKLCMGNLTVFLYGHVQEQTVTNYQRVAVVVGDS